MRSHDPNLEKPVQNERKSRWNFKKQHVIDYAGKRTIRKIEDIQDTVENT